MADTKSQRVTAKRFFTRAVNGVDKAIQKECDVELVESRFNELRVRWNTVQQCHEDYTQEIHGGSDEIPSEHDAWLNELNDIFDDLEQKKVVYIKTRSSIQSHDSMQGVSADESATSTERLKRLRQATGLSFKDDVTDIISFLGESTPSPGVVRVLNDMKISLKSQMDKCQEAHHNYVASMSDDHLASTEREWLRKMKRDFHDVNQKCESFLEACRENQTATANNLSPGIRMQRIQMPSFNGNIRHFPRFKSDFVKQVKPSIKSSESAAYVLRSCLNGEALDIVSNIDDDYDEMWKRLDDKYGKASKLTDVIMNDIKRFKPIVEGDHRRFTEFANLVEKSYRDLCRIKMEQEISNSHAVSLVEEKLPERISWEWAREVNKRESKVDERNKFPYLLDFLLEQRRIIKYNSSDIRVSKDSSRSRVHHVEEAEYDAVDGEVHLAESKLTDQPTGRRCCVHKTDHHTTAECRAFLGLTSEERVKSIKEARGCWSCLRIGHRSADCRFRKKCDVEDCDRFHHKLLHEAHASGIVFYGATNGTRSNAKETCLLQLMKVDSTTEPSKPLNVLWDGGSTVSLITFKKAKELDLVGEPVNLSIVKVGGTKQEIASFVYDVPLKDVSGEEVTFRAYGIDKVSTNLAPIDLSGVVHLFDGITEGDIQRPHGEVDALIGFEYAGYHPVREQSADHLLLMRNRFGVCLSGSHSMLQESTQKLVQNVIIHHLQRVAINDFFETESLGVACKPRCGGCKCGHCPIGSNNYSLKEERELKLIEEGLEHREDHWVAKYPWVKSPEHLPNNKVAAVQMLKSTERRLMKRPEYAEMYHEQICDMIKRGVARKLTDDEIAEYIGPVFYISHHEVLKPESLSTPCRIVFNSSASFKGHVLNDYWAKGPDLLNNMLGVLLRFRERSVAVTGDIRKMYHSVHVSEIDQHTHRFLWRDLDTSKEPETYVMTSVSFGDKPAGNIATVALRKTAEKGADEFPEAAKMIVENTYVDDVLDSHDSIGAAKKITEDANKLLQPGGFEIKEWRFSGCSTDNAIAPIQALQTTSDAETQQKVLGIEWDPKDDKFMFKVRINFSPKYRKQRTGPDLTIDNLHSDMPISLTKRMILSQINGIYDPIGLASPFTVKAKILMRKLCIQGCETIGWDDPLPDEMRIEWMTFFQQLFAMETVSFLRCLTPENAMGDPILILFSDGSELAYGACAYIRWQLSDQTYAARLIAAKSRVAPIRKTSIVRLELNGAVIAKRLAEFVKDESRFEFVKVYYIVDSEIVRAMIQKESYGFNTYAGLRIGEIQDGTNPNQWFWIDGKSNISDWISRGKSPSEIDIDSTWQSGPDFLKLPEEDWPIRQRCKVLELPEQAKKVLLVRYHNRHSITVVVLLERFSSYIRLVRVTARILNVFQNKPHPSWLAIGKVPCKKELDAAELSWVMEAQRELRNDVTSGKFERLCAKIDDRGIITVGGRAQKWIEFSYNNQPVMLLPYSHPFSRLYVTHIHQLDHLGIATTTSKVRLRFWVVNLRKMVKSIQNKCVTCKANRKMKHEQIMGDLPLERLKPAPAFYNTSLDFFGPFDVKGETNQRSRGKAYGVIFNCLLTRAVHAELAVDYSTDAFLIALRRFLCIRGNPHVIHSDTGSQLTAADRELKAIIRGLEKERLIEYGSEKGFEWKFSSSDAPWQNGCSEALVKSMKRALTGAIGKQVLKFSELLTVFYEAANLLNERPIGIHPSHPDDGTYLCPNDLLLGRASPRISAGPFTDDPCPRKRFEFVQMLVNSFWKKWTTNFFPSLLLRQKWHTARRNLCVGDIVLIQDSNMVRGSWRLGRVSSVFPGDDGMVRNVEVQYKNLDSKENPARYRGKPYTTITRPVQRLVVLLPCTDTTGTDAPG